MSEPRYRYRLGYRSLQHVCPSLTDKKARALAVELAEAMVRFPPRGGWTERSAAHFIAQCAHESGEFRYIREIWGPTPVQRGYWRRTRDLGNWLPGHGYTYRGAGWIQVTGRRNFAAAARKLGISLGTLAKRANQRSYASLLAAQWWQAAFPNGTGSRTVREVTRVVNGGYNGLDEREKYYRRAITRSQFLVPKRRKP